MARYVDTVAEYTRIFGRPPSSLTMEVLHALEHHLQLTEGDPLVSFFIMQLRTVDQVAEVLQQRSTDEKRHRDELGKLLSRVEELTSALDDVSTGQARRLKKRTAREAEVDETRIAVQVYRRSLPLLSYLMEAFRLRRGVYDQDQRTVAARMDLALIIGLGLICAGVGVVFFKALS